MTSPCWPQRASKQWNTLSSRLTLKVRPRPSPLWIGQGPRRCGPQPPREAAALLETLARVVHHVHVHGLVHRNLKPDVVLLPAAGGVPKVGSFDLAVLPGRED